MLESSLVCHGPNYSHIFHSLEGIASAAPQLNNIIDTISELKVELAKIKTDVKDLKKQLSVSLDNEVRHSEKAASSVSTPF